MGASIEVQDYRSKKERMRMISPREERKKKGKKETSREELSKAENGGAK